MSLLLQCGEQGRFAWRGHHNRIARHALNLPDGASFYDLLNEKLQLRRRDLQCATKWRSRVQSEAMRNWANLAGAVKTRNNRRIREADRGTNSKRMEGVGHRSGTLDA